jgi:hypothetical protein
MINYDYTDAYKALAATVAGLTLSGGAAKKIEESSMEFPEFDSGTRLPYAVIETAGEMSVEFPGGAVIRELHTLPVRVWYIRNKPANAVAGDTLRADGAAIASALRLSSLGGLVERILIRGIDWSADSASNPFNALARQQNWPACAVAVRIDIETVESP